MTPLALFALLATLLVVAVAAYILTPLWRGSRVSASTADRQAANLAIFRDQLAELEREQGEGTLAPADYLPPGAPAAFAPGADQAVKVWLDIKPLSAAGYRLVVFYP